MVLKNFYKKGKVFPFDLFLKDIIPNIQKNNKIEEKARIGQAAYSIYLSSIIGPYSYITPLKGIKKLYQRSLSEFIGLGISVMNKGKYLEVVQVFPEFHTSFKEGDIILGSKLSQSDKYYVPNTSLKPTPLFNDSDF